MSLCDAIQSVLLDARLLNSRRQTGVHRLHPLGKGRPWDPFIDPDYEEDHLESGSQHSVMG